MGTDVGAMFNSEDVGPEEEDAGGDPEEDVEASSEAEKVVGGVIGL